MTFSFLASRTWLLSVVTFYLNIHPVIGQTPFKTRSDLVPAPWNVTFTNMSAGSLSDSSFIFMAPRVQSPTGLMIFDNNGELVWLNNDSSVQGAFDFRPQNWKGQTYLTYWSGTASTAGFGKGFVYMLDSTYQITHNFTATNMSDFHEFHINADGTAVTSVYSLLTTVDTTGKNFGQANSFVWDGCLQELNIDTGEPASFDFCSLEKGISLFDSFTDPNAPPVDENSGWDYVHVNSAEKDATGNYLMSARHTHTVYYIDGSTGEILWRLGGMNSNFTGDGNEFGWQHDARWIGEKSMSSDDLQSANSGGKRRLTIYDNASSGFDNTGTESRGILVELDFSAMSATIITTYHSPGGETTLLSASQGNVQWFADHSELNSDNVLMSYGSVPVFAEYTNSGDAIRVVHYGTSDSAQGYRIFRDTWTGTPTTAPDAVIQDGVLYVSWNGATEVTQWTVQQGDSQNNLGNDTTVQKSGFETAINIDSTKGATQVMAIGKNGKTLAKSNVLGADGSNMGGAVNGTATLGSDGSGSGSGSNNGGGDDDNGAIASLASSVSIFCGVVAVLSLLVGTTI
ncbi:hypothetical protein K435DRAFT_786229 [Dendrothele bispora CBS 962.96]|uniref:ASST-domain-containing protein n=1 Tax=Dendrothele bispora (strain CBS 962.96) TaxID=1314807 RepID=A0A4S8KS41_DENBC|nr:hypothetical protein K435DRAFT_786229 [Dendrothele bispora CBS 962.96]